MTVIGIDACRTGWIAVALSATGPSAYYLETMDRLAEVIPQPTAIAIDIPIGLPDAARRRADIEARTFLGPRRHSVFFTPTRSALDAATHASATELSRRLTGSGISRQSYALGAKVLEVERWLPTAPCGVWEVHPEVSFALLIGRPARASKKTWSGMVERRKALAGVGIDLDDVSATAGDRAATDDMLDAAAAAWSASRLRDGTARSFPDPAHVDPFGRTIAIWA